MKKIILLLYIFTMNIYSQIPSVDINFAQSYNTNYTQYVGKYSASATNGKLWSIYSDLTSNKIIRLNEDGSIDNTYSPIENPNSTSGYGYTKIYSRADGSFITISTLNIFNSFDNNGVLITNFTSPTFFTPTYYPYSSDGNVIKDIVFQSDGKIIIIGNFSGVNNITCNRIVRLNVDGSVDQNFLTGTGFNKKVNTICYYGNNKLMIGGDFSSYNGTDKNKLLRLNSDGTIDNTFNVNTVLNSFGIVSGFNQEINRIGVQADGKIITSGSQLYSNGNLVSGLTLRLNQDGTKDTSFIFGVNFFNPNCIIIQNDGKILIDNQRLNSNGTNDTSFDSSGVQGVGFLNFYLYNNKIYYNGNYKNTDGITRYAIFRKNTNGSIDKTFNPHFGLNTLFYDVIYGTSCYSSFKPCSEIRTKVLADGSFLVIGNFSSYNDIGCKKISKFDYNGNLDTTFNLDPSINLPTYDTFFYQIVIEEQYDGKLIFRYQNQITIGSQSKYMWRLNSNGSLDNTFNINNPSRKIKSLSDGKFLTVLTGSTSNSPQRLNSDLTVDSSFNCTFTGTNLDFIVLNSGKFLVSRAYNAFAVPIVRINIDGSIDSTFQYPLTATDIGVRKIVEQPDGKLLLSYYGGNSILNPKLKRLNADGTDDISFPVINNGNSRLEYVLDSGKIISTKRDDQLFFGNYTNLNGNVVILNDDGTLNCSFANKNGLISISECNELIYSGPFYEIDGNNKNCLIKYNLSNISPVAPPSGQSSQSFNVGQTLSNLSVTGQNIQWYSNQNYCLTSFNTQKNSNTTFSTLPTSTTLIDGTTYYASQTINNVESFYRLPITVNLALNINDNEFNSLKFYPNPVKENLTISNDLIIKKIELYNYIGQNLITKEFDNINVNLNFNNYNSGIYFVKIFLENYKTEVLKIIKE